MEVALFEPRIPQNTGNIARSCAAFNIPLNLIEPLGFKIEDKYLKRAGLDYWPLVTVNKYKNFEKFFTSKSTKMNSLISLLMKRKSITIIVGEQVGWSLVSEYKIGNTYIERIGELQKRITKISKDNWLAINGRAIKIDEISIEIPT